ncbi:MAG TPA: hypothetical protein VLG39_01080, partial [Nitrospirota bacterium]|nr:hypothetical protein [Nitrospirota bacterium]
MRNINHIRKQHVVVAALMAILTLPALAHAAGTLGKRIVLENGMVLLLSERHDIPMITVNMAITAGSTA